MNATTRLSRRAEVLHGAAAPFKGLMRPPFVRQVVKRGKASRQS